jgi:SAM-dependent methyltransferase
LSEQQGSGPAGFRAFELAGWNGAAKPYADYWGSLTVQAAAPLLDAAEVTASSRVLDVASGPGWVAAAARQRAARVTAVDFSPAMAEAAAAANPWLRYVIGDAEQLPFASGCFDALIMNFGLLHLGRPEEAIAEAARVTQSGGRIAFTVWAPPDTAVLFGIVLRAIEQAGDAAVKVPPGPPFFRFSDADESLALIRGAGLTQGETALLPLRWRLPSAEAAFDAVLRGTARTGGLLRRQPEVARDIIRALVARALDAYGVDGDLDLPMPALLVSARKR